MINLLPPDLKATYRYAQRNVVLVRWVVAFGFSLAVFAALSTAGLIYLHQADQSYLADIAAKQSNLKAQDQIAIQGQVKDISDSLKLAVQVLSKEVLFSKLLTQLATVIPSNTVLTDLSIDESQTALDISAQTANYNAATQLLVNITDPTNKIFSQADIVNINCGSTDPQYPCTVTIRALLAADSPFLFINNGGTTR